jgi:hypothetical protein
MNQVVLVVGSFILGAIVDHFLEARSVASIVKAIKKAEERIIAEVRGKENSKSASAGK